MQFPAHYLRRFLYTAALLIFGLHSLVPVGYMPDFTAKSPLTFMICDGMDHSHDSMQMTPDQMMHMSPEMHAHMHHHGSTHAHAKVCPFSVGGVYSTVAIEIPVIAPFVFGPPEHSEFVIQALPRLIISSAGSPRSPPVFS